MADDAGELRRLLEETSFLYGGNAPFVEELHARWAADPNSVEPSWRSFFARLGDGADDIKRAAAAPGWGAPNGVEALWPALEAKLQTSIAQKSGGADLDAVRAG